MPLTSRPLRKLRFLTIELFGETDPGLGHESTPLLFWRPRRSAPGASVLGTAVTPLGWENPLRLAEDLATVDVLPGGRLNPGISVGPPMSTTGSRTPCT